MSLSTLALALSLLLAAAPARGARSLAAAAGPLLLEPNCARATVLQGVFQLKARATYDCGRTVEGVDRPGGQDALVYFGGSASQCLKRAPSVRAAGTYAYKRSLWSLNFDAVTRSGSISTFDRGCPSGKQSFLTVTSAGELVLSSRPAKWRAARSAAAGDSAFCDDYALIHVASGKALTITGELTCAKGANGATAAASTGALDQILVATAVFPAAVPGL